MKFTTTDKCINDGIKVLVYGKTGAGKTRLCATAPKPLIIAAEGGMLTLRKHTIPVIEIASYDDLLDAFTWVSENKKASRFETICLDSISEIGDIVLQEAKKNVRDKRQAYGELLDEMMILVKKFRDLKGKHVYLSAREAKLIDSEDSTVFYLPDMPGSKLGSKLPYCFDEVFRLEVATKNKKRVRYLRTVSTTKVEAKDRSDVLSAKEQPNLTKIFEKIVNS